MKMTNKLFRILILPLAVLLFFTACQNEVNENSKPQAISGVEGVESTEKGITLKGEIKLSGAVPSRAATSSFNNDFYTWWITAQYSAESDGVSGQPHGNLEDTYCSIVENSNTFSLTLPKAGSWSISISGYAGAYDEETLPRNSQPLFTYDGDPVEFTSEEDYSDMTFYLKLNNFVFDNIGQEAEQSTGNINLLVACDSEAVKCVYATLTKYMDSDAVPVEISQASFTSGKSSLVAYDVPAGIYTAEIFFDDANGNTLYSCKEAITVYPSLTTDTWFGTAPYFKNGEFVLSSNMVEKYPSELVPRTNILLYNYISDDSMNFEQQYSYYLVEANNLNNIETPEVSSQWTRNSINDCTFFDADGNFYLMQILDDYPDETLKSNKTGWGNVVPNSDLGLFYGDKRNFYCTVDFCTNSLFVFEVEQDADTGITLYKYPELISSNGYTFTKIAQTLFPVGSGVSLTSCHYAVNNNILYMISTTSGEDVPYTLRIYDLSSIGSVDTLTASKTVSFDLIDILQIEHVKGNITDMIYQDGSLYMLYKEYDNSFSSGFYSRGAAIKYNLLTGSTEYIGLSSNCVEKDSGFKLQAFSDNYSPSYPLFLDEEKTQEFIPEVSAEDYPDIYQPATNENSFYGPSRFIAIIPNMLVISDEGMQYYTNNHDVLCRKNVNRCVFVDLKKFSIKEIKSINSTLSMNEDNLTHCFNYSQAGQIQESDGVSYYYGDNGIINVGNYYLGIVNTDNQ